MFQPHSFLWHYLWVAPNLLLAALAIILSKRGLHRELRAFCVYAWFQVIEWSVLYPMDLIPSVPAAGYWRVCWASLLIESITVFILISDLFADVFGSYTALAHLGRRLIRWGGVLLLITATMAGAGAADAYPYWYIPASLAVQEGMYIVVSGLVLLLFAAAAYFRLAWNHRVFGIALGLGINGCVHLATWAIMANGLLFDKSRLLNMANMATSHVVVLMWFYYLLVPVPHKASAKPVVLPENNLALWNRELERLLQQ
jgi:hypothetical protein